jgi:hypothetical protein
VDVPNSFNTTAVPRNTFSTYPEIKPCVLHENGVLLFIEKILEQSWIKINDLVTIKRGINSDGYESTLTRNRGSGFCYFQRFND